MSRHETSRPRDGRLPATGETYVMFNNIPRVTDSQRFVRLHRALSVI